MPVVEFRQECRKFAEGWIDIQREEFKRLGVTGNWDDPYLTMDYHAEAVIAEEFMKFLMNGTLYQGSKPVMWSPVEKTALAEAEVEYHDHRVAHDLGAVPGGVRGRHRPRATRRSLADLRRAVVIWTTTPWTIPQNRAVSYNPEIAYGLYEVTEAPARTRPRRWAKSSCWPTSWPRTCSTPRGSTTASTRACATSRADELGALICAHPYRGIAEGDGEWDYDVPLLPGDHVTDEAGTGFVHTAPSHGEDDYQVGLKYGLPMTYNVEPDGTYRADLPVFGGQAIIDPDGKEGPANVRQSSRRSPSRARCSPRASSPIPTRIPGARRRR